MEERRTILVSGATGQPGGAVARSLLDRGFRVRALTRDPQKPEARAPTDQGVEVVQGDAYGKIQSSNNWVVRHVITVTGLSANTRYHYQVESEDEAGNPATSADLTFKTAR